MTAPAYPSAAVREAHPARIRAAASMHGVGAFRDAPFRYMEIGCGAARNLVPLAVQFPAAQFVGADIDPEVIARGRELAEAAGVKNLRLVTADVRDFDPGEEPFDYVVSHGVYSWVPEDARDRMLALAAQTLAPLGIAYISYNTFPGWGLRTVVRDVMRAAAGSDRGEAGLRAARAKLSDLRRRLIRQGHPYTTLLQAELDLALGKADGYLLGEHLAEVNDPVHVQDFLAGAARHGLGFVCDLLPATPEGNADMEIVADLLASGSSRADAEGCLDVLTYRQFRATLLCHTGVPRTDFPSFEGPALDGYFSAALTPLAEEPLLGPGKRLLFRAPGGAEIESDRPLLKAALLVIARAWPRSIGRAALWSTAVASLRERGLLAGVDEAELRGAMADLLQLCRRRLIEVLPWAPLLAADIPRRPRARLLARLEAERSPVVTSVLHEPMLLDEPMRTVLRLLDGTRDVRALIGELSSRMDTGELSLDLDGPRPVRLAELLRNTVSRIHTLGLLDPDAEAT